MVSPLLSDAFSILDPYISPVPLSYKKEKTVYIFHLLMNLFYIAIPFNTINECNRVDGLLGVPNNINAFLGNGTE